MVRKTRNKMEKLIITPRTKIHDLLEAYPELEELLISAAPPFKKLKNPVLRRTIARVTTLAQAATIGGLNVEELVNTLREEVGQAGVADLASDEYKYNTEQPAWFLADRIKENLDIRDMLNEGEQPVHLVLSSLKKLKEREILETIAPFVPAPLIDKATGLGYDHWVLEIATDEIRVYFTKQ